MPLINLHNITIGHGPHPLLENASVSIDQGEHVCLIGRNGVGKSTLLKLLYGDIEPDNGSIEKQQSLQIALLSQAVPHALTGKILDIVATGIISNHDDNHWQKDHKVDKILSKLGLDGEMAFETLSGGLKRRVLLAKALVNEPDLLLLDEPTNHLDIEAIKWLENFLLNFNKTLLFVTHDRVLMQNVATHIIEIDNGQTISWRGHYQDYLKYKQTAIEAENTANALFDKKLAQEEVWIRQGIKARRTRNEGRVRTLKKLRAQQSNRRSRVDQVNIQQQTASNSGKIVFEVDNISYGYEDKEIIKNFSTVISRGDKIGIIGSNGSGKSTLINLLIGKLKPNIGAIKLGTKLEIAYFDQHRHQLDESKTVLDNVSEANETITIGNKTKHVISYLQDFLFSPQRARSLVKTLSGGECNRVTLAKLLTKPCNVLILDEPTNDLDIETLELLEEYLLDYSGTLLLVSHDRAFLNNIVSKTLVMEDSGHIGEYVGGYDDWLRQRKKPINSTKKSQDTKRTDQKPKKSAQKLGSKEKRELAVLPEEIDDLETKQQDLQQKLSSPNFYKDHADEIISIKQQLNEIEKTIKARYKRWEELENLHHDLFRARS